jgi:hypothetical protein
LNRREADVPRLAAPLLALALASCIVVEKKPADSGGNPPPQQPVRHNNPPPPPPRTPGYEGDLKMKYDTALDDCFEAARKVMGLLNLTEVDQNKKSGVIQGQRGSVFGRCSMYRRNHHTYVTFYFKTTGGDARTPHDFAKNAHASLGRQIKEEGRKTD